MPEPDLIDADQSRPVFYDLSLFAPEVRVRSRRGLNSFAPWFEFVRAVV